jgi:hypothetical protein
MFDFSAGRDVLVASNQAPGVSDGVLSYSLANPARFVAPGTLAVSARLEWTNPDTSGDVLWYALVDQIRWRFQP